MIYALLVNFHFISVLREITLISSSKCELCKAYSITPPRPVVSMPMAKQFNEKVPIDLKQYKGRCILYMIDMWSRYTMSVFISRKKPNSVIEALIKN